MTDYDWSIGNSGTMRIRVLATTVEFWITANNSTTFAYNMPWGYTVNGVTNNSKEYRYNAGAYWEKIGSWSVTYSQTVTFRLFDTGTSGLGSGATHSVFVDRADRPSPPTKPAISSITHNSAYVTFSDGSNNGASIDSRQIGYGTSSSSPTTTVSSDKSTTITGLSTGTRYYVWARTHNSEGWSDWSARAYFDTDNVPSKPSPVSVANVSQVAMDVTWAAPTDNGAAIDDYEVSYNKVGEPATTVSTGTTRSATLTGLTPGSVYNVSVRAHNAAGWGAYSTATSQEMLAGAFVYVGGVKKRAIPWYNDNGTWKVARPWGRISGTWKETI